MPVDKLPKGIKETKTSIFAKGSHGHNHTFKGGKLYLKNESNVIFGYMVANKTKLYHSEHSPKGCEITDGVYQLRKGQEIVNKEMVKIID